MKPKNYAQCALVSGVVTAAGAFLLLQHLLHGNSIPRTRACIANLKHIRGAIKQWALENHFSATNQVTIIDISGSATNFIKPLINVHLRCPAGGIYTITTVGEVPRCSTSGHTL
jgi:hypothetical protein